MRWLCVLFSLLLHGAAAVAGVYLSTALDMRLLPGEQVVRVDLVRVVPERVEAPASARVASPRTVRQEHSSTRAASPPPQPAVTAPVRPVPKPPVARAPLQPPPSQVQPEAEAPQGKPIATTVAEAPPPVSALRSDSLEEAREKAKVLAQATAVQKGDTTYVAGLHGFAAMADTFGLDMCGADTFEPEDYFGHYKVGRDRFVSVIDGREDHGSFLLYDSATGLYRLLHRRSEMIFVYGPTFSRHDPVVGSVTILPKKDRYDNKLILKPAQLIWLPPDPPMKYGTRIDFHMREVAIESGGATLPGTVVLRDGVTKAPGVVLTFCTQCVPREQVLGFAQVLALNGMAVLVYDVRTCGVEAGADPERALADDALAAVRVLRGVEGVDSERVGLWGKDGGAHTAALAASRSVEPDFLVLTYAQAGPADRVRRPPPDSLAGVLVPTLLLFSGRGSETLWSEHVAEARRVRDGRGRPVEWRILEDETEDENPDAPAMQPLSIRYARLVAPWLAGASE